MGAELERPEGGLVVRRWRLAEPVGREFTDALGAVRHPLLAEIVAAEVEGDALVVRERAVAGEPLEPGTALTDKALALGAELMPALEALAAAGLAHGRVAREALVRGDDALVLTGASGLRPDGTRASAADDVRGLAELMASMLGPKAPPNIVEGLARMALDPPPLGDVRALIVRLRAAIPVAPHRHIRSIQRLAFPAPVNPPRRSKRYILRIVLITGVVALGLWAAFSQPEAAKEAKKGRDTRGVVYIRMPPLDAQGSDGR